MSEISFDDAKNFLLKNENGNNLYDHLTKVLAKLIVESPEDSLDSFEAISRYMKDSIIKPRAPKSKTITDKALLIKQQKWIDQTLKLTEEPKDESEQSLTITGLQDWLRDSRLFEWAGVGFPAQENYAIYCSLRKLASITEGIKNLRFFGKIFGQSSDYLIAEGEIESPPEGEIPESYEPHGVGANKFVYWVASDASSEWRMLPPVSPDEIIAARQLKRVLTGNLEAPVVSYPPFPGNEESYLRALISIIAAETVLCPVGAFVNPEDEENPDHIIEKNQDEEWTFPTAEELKAFDGWTHCRSGLLKIGKVAYPVADEEDTELVEKIETMKEDDPEQPALRTLETDKPVVPPTEDGDEPGPEGAWVIRQAGDKCVYSIDDKEVTFGVAVVSSLRWPGAVNIAQGNVFSHIYVGYGIQAGAPAFSPGAPADVQDEPAENAEEPEPTPLEEEIASDGGDEDEDAGEEDEEEL